MMVSVAKCGAISATLQYAACTLYRVRQRPSLLAVEVPVVFLVILTSLTHKMRLLLLTRHSRRTESTGNVRARSVETGSRCRNQYKTFGGYWKIHWKILKGLWEVELCPWVGATRMVKRLAFPAALHHSGTRITSAARPK